ncbi:MAG: diaminopimelate epimerase [Deltaproteobacteria bacterium]|jgi:diaminopimelate epimerase
MRVAFAKYQGLGNDFVVVRAEDARITAAAARRLCDRRRGIGADGVLTVSAPRVSQADVRMHVFNADGSVAQMCGNGLRCVVRFVLGGDGRVAVDTDAGVLQGHVDGGTVSVTMGHARLTHANVDAAPFAGVGVSMGNPHLVLDPLAASDDLMALAREHGPRLERHPQFPERTNVELCRVRDDGDVDLVVFERGSGITDACGTGASATVAALAKKGRVPYGEVVTVHLPGGPLGVKIEADDATLGAVTIAGDAVHVFDGAIELAPEELAG